MNTLKIALPLAALLVATACDRTPPASGPATTEAPAAAPAAPAPEPAAQPMGDAVLLGGYVPDFPHKVRSSRESAVADGSAHVVVVEYLEVDREAAIARLGASLKRAGFRVRGPHPRGDAMRLVGTKDGRRLVALFFPAGSHKLRQANAQGVVRFAWTEAAVP
jgi:hypothetical protein